jgi:hypothetical protein
MISVCGNAGGTKTLCRVEEERLFDDERHSATERDREEICKHLISLDVER